MYQELMKILGVKHDPAIELMEVKIFEFSQKPTLHFYINSAHGCVMFFNNNGFHSIPIDEIKAKPNAKEIVSKILPLVHVGVVFTLHKNWTNFLKENKSPTTIFHPIFREEDMQGLSFDKVILLNCAKPKIYDLAVLRIKKQL